MSDDLNSYGSYIGSIIIMLVFLVGLIIIIDEIYNVTKFCYRYTYLYNFGKTNETTCKDSKLEYETARFRIYNEIANYKFTKDLFSKSWLNYAYFITILILSILLCLAFGYFFKYLFIDNNNDCEVSNPYSDSDHEGWSVLKLIMRCFCGSCHQFIPTCFTNYLLLGTILIIYPLIYISKVIFKVDFTWNNGGYLTKMLHLIFFIMIVFYIYYIYIEKEKPEDLLSKNSIKPKYIKMIIYITFIAIFYANNYFFNSKFDEYTTLQLISNSSPINNENDDTDTIFFDIYKQEAPIKPLKIEEPIILKDFKYCTLNDFTNSKNYYCYNVHSKRNINTPDSYYNKDDPYYKCISANNENKILINKYIANGDHYSVDKMIIEDYYKKLKKYEEDMKIYNYKYNIYKNNRNEFPDIVYFLFHMLPKMTSIDKKEIQLLFILIIIVIILTYYLKISNDNHMDYVYYTVYLYLLGIISISVLVNAILTYNTYVNKYLIYEPLHNYKNALYNKNIILNIIINRDPALRTLYELNTDKFIDKLNINSLSKTLNYTIKPDQKVTLDEFADKIKKEPTTLTSNSDDFYNSNSPTPIPIKYLTSDSGVNFQPDDYTFHIQLKFYKTIYSSLLNNDAKSKFQMNYLINRPAVPGSRIIDPYLMFNYYKDAKNTNSSYLKKDLTTVSIRDDEGLLEVSYFLNLIERNFIDSETNISKKINQLKLNYDYYIYSNPDDSKITILNNYMNISDPNKKFIDSNINYFESQIMRDNTSKSSKDSNLDNIIRNYRTNRILIDKAFGIYSEFLVEFRKLIVTFFNNCGIACDYIDYIDIDNKLNQLRNKLFLIRNPKRKSDIKFKTENEDKNINIYKQIIINTMKKLNDLMDKYMNLIKCHIRSFTTITLSDSVGSKTKTPEEEIITEIISNYNIYNLDSERHITSTLERQDFNLDPNYKKSKYDNFDTIDIKKMKISSDNVSWSFIILIIIFAIILIEPTVI